MRPAPEFARVLARVLALALVAAFAVLPAAARAADGPPAADPALKARCAAGELEGCTAALQRLIAAREAPKVKARLPELGRRCEQGTVSACAEAAQAYAFPDPSVQDLARSAQLARKACDRGAAAGCLMLGMDLLRGQGVKADPAEGAKLVRRACEQDRANGCWILGILHHRGEGVQKDAKEARRLFQRACEAKLLIACVDLRRLDAAAAGQESLGPKGAVGDDLDPASVYPLPFQGALDYCRRGDLDACAQAAWHLLSGATAETTAAKEEAELAVLLLEATCARGSAYDCMDMAQRFEEGRGPVPKDPARAESFYRKACEGGATRACLRVKPR